MKKNVRNIAQLMLVILIFLGGCRLLNLLYVPEDEWHRILFHSYYTQERNIDQAFIGSSHILCDVEPLLLDKINGYNNFNMSSPQQRFDASYYLLKEMAEDHELKHVYLECYYLCVVDHEIYDKNTGTIRVSDYIGDPDHFASSWQISYAMKPSLNSVAIQLHASDKDHMMENLIPFVRYREKLFDWEHISDNLSHFKPSSERGYSFHIDYEEPDGSQWYQEYHIKGDNSSNGRVFDSEKTFPKDRDLTRFGIGEKSRSYLCKSIEFCQKNNIPVTLFVSPVLDFQLLSTGDYDSYVTELKSLADGYGIECYDMNLIKREYLDIKRGEYYMDPEHLNTAGAEVYTEALWNVLSDSADNNMSKFYTTYSEKLAAEEPEIYGLYWMPVSGDLTHRDDSNPDIDRQYTIASNRDDMEYTITNIVNDPSSPSGKAEYIIQKHNKNNTIVLPSTSHGTLRIESEYEGSDLMLEVGY